MLWYVLIVGVKSLSQVEIKVTCWLSYEDRKTRLLFTAHY